MNRGHVRSTGPHPGRTAVVVLLVAAASVACGEGGADPRAEIAMDTLAHGTIHVRNPASGLWARTAADAGWRLDEVVRIGSTEGDGADVFGQIRGLAVDSRGRVHVLDHQAHEVRVFGSDGAHLRTLGGPGEGPSELSLAFGLGIDAADRVWVADQGNNRYTVWDSAGRLEGTRARPFISWPFIWSAAFDGDRLLESGLVTWGTGERREVLLRLGLHEAAVDTLPLPASPIEPEARIYSVEGDLGAMYIGVPFAPDHHIALNPRGQHYWVGTSDRYRLHQVGLDEDTVRIVVRDYDPIPVTRAERDSALSTPSFERMREQGGEVDPGRVPSTKPAFQWLIADDRDHVWVRIANPERQGGTRLDVFEPEGYYLGQVSTDLEVQALPRPVIRDGMLWARISDELDVSYVVGMRIVPDQVSG